MDKLKFYNDYNDLKDKNLEFTNKKPQFKDVNLNYIVYLIEKYCKSNGIGLGNYNVDQEDFTEWLKLYIDMTKSYSNFIKSYGICLDEANLAELGKGKFDSIIKENAYEISKFSETMKRSKLIFGDVFKELLIYQDNMVVSLDDLNIDTLISQNPNNAYDIKNLIILSNLSNKQIVLGMYGNFSEKDIKSKTRIIKNFLEETNHNEFEFDTEKDNFYMFARVNKPKIKTLSR